MDSKLVQEDTNYVLIVERVLAHPPEKVWRAVTEHELLHQWFPADIDGKWVAGTELAFAFRHGEGDGLSEEEMRGLVYEVDEPRLLEFSWGAERIKLELEAEGDGTRFRLSHTIADASWGARNAAGWEMCFDNLQLIIEGLAAVKFMADVWQKKFKHYVKVFEPEFGPQDDPTGESPLL